MSESQETSKAAHVARKYEHSLEMRVAVITLRFFYHEPWAVIGRRLDMNQRTVQGIYERAEARCNNAADFKELLACARNAERSGRPPKSDVLK